MQKIILGLLILVSILGIMYYFKNVREGLLKPRRFRYRFMEHRKLIHI